MIELSVVIPTYNKKSILEKTLLSFNDQSCPLNKFEVVVVDDGSERGINETANKITPKLKYIISFVTQNHKGPAAARNKGIKMAKGRIILIINDDTVATRNLVKKHLEFHERHQIDNAALLGYLTWHPDLKITPFMYWLEHGGPYFSFSEIKENYAGWERFWTCNISLKKNFLLENGLFDEQFLYASWEDIELGYRLGKKGLKLYYDKNAIGYHFHPTTIESIKQKMRKNGESAILLKKKMPKKFLPPLTRTPITQIITRIDTQSAPLILLLEKIALWAERRMNLGVIFDIVLLHYRIEGVKRALR